jgi:hypothetical protein
MFEIHCQSQLIIAEVCGEEGAIRKCVVELWDVVATTQLVLFGTRLGKYT